MPYTKQQVYQPENLRFATKAEGREPTLYFRTNHGSGRLRQEHGSGPLVQDVRKHTTHAFFSTKDQVKAFHTAAKLEYKAGTLTRDRFRELRTEHGGHHTPFDSAFHAEGTFTGHGGDSRVAQFDDGRRRTIGLHRSGGQVVTQETLGGLRAQTTTIATRMGAYR